MPIAPSIEPSAKRIGQVLSREALWKDAVGNGVPSHHGFFNNKGALSLRVAEANTIKQHCMT